MVQRKVQHLTDPIFREKVRFFQKNPRSRREYVETAKKNGFEVCECNIESDSFTFHNNYNWEYRDENYREQGAAKECADCHKLLFPLELVYECDECCEPVLAHSWKLRKDEPFYCSDCIWTV